MHHATMIAEKVVRVVIMVTIFGYTSFSAEHLTTDKDFCLPESVNLRCKMGEVVLISSAQYGRMSADSRCISAERMIGCQADTTKHVREMCMGRRNCSFLVSTFLAVTQPCSHDDMSYLSLSYYCEKVLWVEPNQCGKKHTLRGTSGYISYSSSGPNAPRDCPWRISVSKSQTIKFTLSAKHGVESTCPYLVTFREHHGRRDVSVNLCSGLGSHGEIYNTTSNEVQFYFQPSRVMTDSFDFLIKYTVSGCPELRRPDGGWVIQDGAVAEVQCNKTKETWYLTCQGNRWLGDFDNCSDAGGLGEREPRKGPSPTPYPLRLVMAIMLGIVIGIIAGLVLLAAVYLCYRRKSKHEYEQAGVPMDYFTECQQKQVYASMLRDEIQHKCPVSSDYPQATDRMLPCAHVDLLLRQDAPMCPTHHVLASPPPAVRDTNSSKINDTDQYKQQGPSFFGSERIQTGVHI